MRGPAYLNAKNSMPRQQGFTLLEIMVVVLIIAVMAGISILAIRQAEGRTLQGQAERLQIWLQALADRSILEQNAYGVRLQENSVQAFVYYQRYWYPVRDPEPFSLPETVQLQMAGQAPEPVEENNELLPSLVFSQGNMIPANAMTLTDNSSRHYQLAWDDELGEIQLQAEGGNL